MGQQPRHWVIVVHGGAGGIDREALGPVRDKEYREALSEAVKAGAAMLDHGGSSLDAVEAAARVMEDDPHFNAARGAVFTADGKTQLDAAIMDGATLRAGAVADVTHTRHPITLARAVMEKTPYVLVVGSGADAFSLAAGLEQKDAAFFFTETRWQSLVKQLQKEGKPIPPRPARRAAGRTSGAAGAMAGAGRHEPLWHGRRSRSRSKRERCRRHVDRRFAGQDAGPRGRFATDRRGHVRFKSVVRGFRDRRGRVFYPLHRGARDLRSGSTQGLHAATGCR